jgi:hypothetical protein
MAPFSPLCIVTERIAAKHLAGTVRSDKTTRS